MGVRERQNRTFRSFKISQKADENKSPYIFESVKVDGKYTEGDVAPELYGKLTNIELKSTDYKGETLKWFALTLDDGEELNIINISHGSLCRDILNKLASDETDLSKDISISVYRKESQGKDGKTYYNAVSAVRDDETKDLLSWWIHPNELPKIEVTVSKSGKKFVDSVELEKFFETEVFNKIKSKLNGQPTPTETKPETKKVEKPVKEVEEVIEEEDVEDDLPF